MAQPQKVAAGELGIDGHIKIGAQRDGETTEAFWGGTAVRADIECEGGLAMNDSQDPDWLELSRLLQEAKPLVAPLYPDQQKQWAAGSPVAQEISALLARHPEFYDEIQAQIGKIFAKP